MKHVSDAHRPVLLTSRGRGVAVVQSVADYEQTENERAFMRAVVEGLADLEEGREVCLPSVLSRIKCTYQRGSERSAARRSERLLHLDPDAKTS